MINSCTRALWLVLCVGGCGGAGGGADMASDGARACGLYGLQTVIIDHFEQIDPMPRIGALVRVRAVYRRGECDAAGPPLLSFETGPMGTAAYVTAQLWSPDAAGCAATLDERPAIVLSDGTTFSNPALTVIDAGIDQGITLPIQLGAAPQGATCSPAALGSPCQLDCQCIASLPRARCVPQGASGGTCAIPCSEDADCPDSSPRCLSMPAMPLVCGSTSCAADADCRFGQRCVAVGAAHACRPAQNAISGAACGCDGGCGFGGLCGGSETCILPCVSTNDCRTGSQCNGGSCTP